MASEIKDLTDKVDTMHELLIRVDERQSQMTVSQGHITAQLKALPCTAHAIMIERQSVKTGILASVFGAMGAGIMWAVAHFTSAGK